MLVSFLILFGPIKVDFPMSPAFSQQAAAKSAHEQPNGQLKSVSTKQQAKSHQAQQASRVAVFKWVDIGKRGGGFAARLRGGQQLFIICVSTNI